jgi:hypothetical protein
MTKSVAQSASRALGLLIAKYKNMGGMPYDVFTKLYDSCVWPVIAYGAAIWGFRSYSCINAIHNRAMRVYLGVGKYTPTAAVAGDMGWLPADVKQWESICSYWYCIVRMPEVRINKIIFNWAFQKATRYCKNWIYVLIEKFKSLNCNNYCDMSLSFSKEKIKEDVMKALKDKYISSWVNTVNTDLDQRQGRNKLRTYKLFKNTYNTERYCKVILPLKHRAAFAKFRCGVAPLRIETGRYEQLHVIDRI